MSENTEKTKAELKSIKEELLRAVNDAAPDPEKVAKDDMIDNMLSDYFSSLSRMPRELTLEAITNGLLLDRKDSEESKQRIKKILDKYLP
ncbi:MAG: hypothetical protein GC185_09420 [Alphaproteobacteria bacterium]|nr:hypothetical protein [Alphaproteobacteria bacterium]